VLLAYAAVLPTATTAIGCWGQMKRGRETAASHFALSPQTCTGDAPTPAGFRVSGRERVPQPGHVGTRIVMTDGWGRALHYEIGIAGEFAEGTTPRGPVTVLGGYEAQMYGAGSVWTVIWEEGGSCGDRVVIGNGISRRGFVEVMSEAGVIERST